LQARAGSLGKPGANPCDARDSPYKFNGFIIWNGCENSEFLQLEFKNFLNTP
jgi:hypothetical protein